MTRQSADVAGRTMEAEAVARLQGTSVNQLITESLKAEFELMKT